ASISPSSRPFRSRPPFSRVVTHNFSVIASELFGYLLVRNIIQNCVRPLAICLRFSREHPGLVWVRKVEVFSKMKKAGRNFQQVQRRPFPFVTTKPEVKIPNKAAQEIAPSSGLRRLIFHGFECLGVSFPPLPRGNFWPWTF